MQARSEHAGTGRGAGIGLILNQMAEEWRSMDWSMTQVSGLAQTLFKARMRWIDGVSSARRAMEQAVSARLGGQWSRRCTRSESSHVPLPDSIWRQKHGFGNPSMHSVWVMTPLRFGVHLLPRRQGGWGLRRSVLSHQRRSVPRQMGTEEGGRAGYGRRGG